MKKWIWLLILNFFIAAPAFAAGTLTAKLNRNPVPVGETFVLSLEYEGDPGSEKPDFSPLNRDFTVYMVSNSYKGIYTNGKMKKLYIWNVTMAADRTGAFTIPPLSVGKAESRPITLKVVAADGLPPAKDGKPAAPKFSAVPMAIPILFPRETNAYWNPSFLSPVFHSPYSTQSGMIA